MSKQESNERDILLSIYSDVYKDVHGFRPRGSAFPSNLSNEEIEARLEALEDDLGAILENEEEDDYEDHLSIFDSYRNEILGEDS